MKNKKTVERGKWDQEMVFKMREITIYKCAGGNELVDGKQRADVEEQKNC